MATMTVLELVKDILNSLDEDPVNSINDTVLAQDVAQIVKTTYYNIIDGRHWPHLYEMFQLTALADSTKPNYFQIPTTIVDVKWVKYNNRRSTDTLDKYTKLKYLTPEQFVTLCDARNSSNTNITVVSDPTGVTLNIRNDIPPTYYTSFDDNYIIFDAYDTAVDTTVQASKVKCWGKRSVSFTISDTFTPDLPEQEFSYLLAEAKATASIEKKQTPNSKAEQNSITQRRRMSQDAWKVTKGIVYPNYGRKK